MTTTHPHLEGLIRSLRGLSDNAYCRYIRTMRHTDCLGWEAKVQAGKFGSEQLRAHVNAGEWLGMHRAYAKAADELEAALAALPGGGVACGGCGETDAAKRCIGCLHPFTPAWMPIETAPERGSFLIYGGEWVGESGRRYKSEIAQVNRANGGKFYLADAEEFWPWVENATHWMPQPQAPVTPTPHPHEADRNE